MSRMARKKAALPTVKINKNSAAENMKNFSLIDIDFLAIAIITPVLVLRDRNKSRIVQEQRSMDSFYYCPVFGLTNGASDRNGHPCVSIRNESPAHNRKQPFVTAPGLIAKARLQSVLIAQPG
jgi:hypothetical protein